MVAFPRVFKRPEKPVAPIAPQTFTWCTPNGNICGVMIQGRWFTDYDLAYQAYSADSVSSDMKNPEGFHAWCKSKDIIAHASDLVKILKQSGYDNITVQQLGKAIMTRDERWQNLSN